MFLLMVCIKWKNEFGCIIKKKKKTGEEEMANIDPTLFKPQVSFLQVKPAGRRPKPLLQP